MFSDNILKLINSIVYYNHTLNLTNAFLTLPLTSSCTVILFNVQTTPICFYCNSSSFLLYFFLYSCCKKLLLLIIIIFVGTKKNDNNKKKKKRKKNRASHTHTHTHICAMYSMNMLKMTMQGTFGVGWI